MLENYTDELLLKAEKPEFQRVVYLEKNIDILSRFFEDNKYCVDYLQPYLEKMIL